MSVVDNASATNEALESIKESQNTDRKRALAKVYGLLIKLADETENPPAMLEVISPKKEDPAEQNLIQLTLL